jgi:TPP-dependent pyruvate/acetoin dehydrogenase alpha subunit
MSRAVRIAAAEAHLAKSAAEFAARHPLAKLSRKAREAVEDAYAKHRSTLDCTEAVGQELVAVEIAARYQDGDVVTYRVRDGIHMLIATWKRGDQQRQMEECALRVNLAQRRLAEAMGSRSGRPIRAGRNPGARSLETRHLGRVTSNRPYS